MFEVLDRDGLGRLGVLETRHGRVRTPALVPVVNPNKVLISPAEMATRFGAEIVITNAYILSKSREQGETDLHARLGFPGPIMTDSGAFQQHVYGDVDASNKEIVEYQAKIGSDLVTMLDVFSEPEHTRARAAKDVDETLARAAEAVAVKKAWTGDPFALVGAVQGGIHPEERTRSAAELSKLDVDVAAEHPNELEKSLGRETGDAPSKQRRHFRLVHADEPCCLSLGQTSRLDRLRDLRGEARLPSC